MVGLPAFEIRKIRAKIDSGAKTSALHAFDIRLEKVGHRTRVHFKIHPRTNDSTRSIACAAWLVDKRKVKSSNGKAMLRPVIRTPLEIGSHRVDVEFTLVNRQEMGFRLLIGREALVKMGLLIDVSRSYLQKRHHGAS